MASIGVSGGVSPASIDIGNFPDALRATGHLAESMPRHQAGINNSALATGRLQLMAIYLKSGITVTNLLWLSGDTAANTPTNWWFALYNSSLALLGQTADQTTTAWAANTLKTVALATPYAVPTSGLYYAGVMVTATTCPSLVGIAHRGADLTDEVPKICGTSTTGLTTTAPDPAAAITAAANTLWCAVS